ncbi:L,D-peptidoglycan transpeptidase YkuD, ErfK/YbiS/YcfS/YnhG family [Brevibacterium siliguriense]|uniref:L,D-peptidoglycan transpeptidase YkuD, ErfK/YbiS/YcfS/YnhG family n=1 Tax=Brevibacterium siliguriense TaxID=1136497 RepID=A0A1H1UR28_9MICO|nr:hypothetical protein [Brevibacterium siliguriense]SDS74943.1 L,D-peptidoglycan transpeptidase YkuD, ErfK/YbiS/YcfS/YnhG family [Brevibacterium siliguriense]
MNTPTDQLSTSTGRSRSAFIAVALIAALVAAFFTAFAPAEPAHAGTRYCTGIEGNKKVKASKVIEARQKTKTTGYVFLCQKKGSRYVLKGIYKAKFGYNGTTTRKREGDGKTPRGTYWMRNGFGTAKNPGLGKSWTKATRDHVWVDGKASKARGYNTMQRKSRGYRGETLYQPKPYKYAQVIGYNEARTPGKGSAIFLHANTKSMKTAGCISLYEASLKKVMRWEGATKTQIVIH